MCLQGLDQTLLVHWACAGYDLEVHDAVGQLPLVEGLEFGPCDYVAVGVGVVAPETYAAAYLAGGGRGVARDDLDLDAGVAALGDGCGHLLAHGIRYGGYAEHCEAAAYAFGGYSLLAVGQRAECECERTHGLILILGQRGTYAFALLLRHVAHRKQYLGRTLHIEDSPAGLGR